MPARGMPEGRGSSEASGRRSRRALVALACSALAALSLTFLTTIGPASAQGWWPWAEQPPPVPRTPMRPPPPPPAGAPPPQSFGGSSRSPICVQLEQRLAMESRSGAREQLPQIENDMRAADRAVQGAQQQLDRNNCYEWFFFQKSLRPGRFCADLASQVEAAKRRLADLDAQRQQILQSSGRSMRDDIVRELARNNCGPGYTQEASRGSSPFSTLWQDEDGGWGGNRFGGFGQTTFRTVCVRLCDGAFFPVSFSTVPGFFDRDQDICQDRCAAPAELYYHQNPGAGMDQAISHKTKQPYSALRTAFRFRKEFVNGCSCKKAEFVPQGTTPQAAADRRADAQPAAGGTPVQPPPRR